MRPWHLAYESVNPFACLADSSDPPAISRSVGPTLACAHTFPLHPDPAKPHSRRNKPLPPRQPSFIPLGPKSFVNPLLPKCNNPPANNPLQRLPFVKPRRAPHQRCLCDFLPAYLQPPPPPPASPWKLPMTGASPQQDTQQAGALNLPAIDASAWPSLQHTPDITPCRTPPQ